jgi:hypothetical protein
MLWLRYVSPCQRRRVQDQGLQIYIANERFRMCFTLCQCKFGLTVCFLGGQIRCCLHQWRRYSCARKPRQRLRAWGTVSFHLLVQNSLQDTFLTLFRGVFTDSSLGPVLYYHYVDTTIGYADNQKLFGWNKIDFSSGWPVV